MVLIIKVVVPVHYIYMCLCHMYIYFLVYHSDCSELLLLIVDQIGLRKIKTTKNGKTILASCFLEIHWLGKENSYSPLKQGFPFREHPRLT